MPYLATNLAAGVAVTGMMQAALLSAAHSRSPYDCNMGDARPSFADLVSSARRAKGMSQDELEAESGVSRGTLSRWERGLADRPEPENVRAVCAVLGIDPRQAAVSLGYLTAAEVEGPGLLRPEVEEVLTMLEDPSLPADDREKWIDYLKFLYRRAQEKAS